MKIELDIHRHCIETAARLKYEHLVRACLKEQTIDQNAQIELLIHFLKSADFNHLRTAINQLGFVPHKATLLSNEDACKLRLEIEHIPVHIIWNKE